MKVFVKGGSEIKLSKADFLGSGGEGEVYVKGSTAYKIYHDASKMIPLGKIQELAAIHEPRVIRPDRVLADKRNKPVGYTMRFVPDAWTLCQLFPRSFRDRNNLDHDQIIKLVQGLQEIVQGVHRARVLIVDLNEMNFLVAKDFDDIYAIDADSYQTRGYPATAIMPSIEDPLVQGYDFTELSDWFSFAVVTFQMFIGIHPFKGKHPSIKGMEKRMKAGVSVFHPDVKMPKVVYPLDVIPPAYRQWYEAVLENGKRVAPPTDLTGAIVITPVIRTIAGTQQFDIPELFSFGGNVLGSWEAFGAVLSVCEDGIYAGRHHVGNLRPGLVGTAFTPRQNKGIVAFLDGTSLSLYDTTDRRDLDFPFAVEQAMSTGDRLYVKIGEQIHEVTMVDTGARVIASPQPVANCMKKATKLYDGVAIQNMLGSIFATMLPESGKSYTTHVKELDEYRIVEAKADRNVLMVIGHKSGQYDRLVVRFSTVGDEYDVRVVEDITPAGLNFVALDTGVCALINEDEKLELFAAKRGHQGVKVIEDKILGGDMRLGRHAGKVVFWRGDKIYRLEMK